MKSVNWGVVLTKLGKAVKDCLPKDVSISTKYPPIKILESGQIVINLPAETVADFGESLHEGEYAHNLGYLPLMFPLNISNTPPDPHPLGTADWIIDDGIQYDPGGTSPVSDTPGVDAYAYVNYSANKIEIDIYRYNFSGGGSVNFPAKRAILNYTFLDLNSSVEVNYININ